MQVPSTDDKLAFFPFLSKKKKKKEKEKKEKKRNKITKIIIKLT